MNIIDHSKLSLLNVFVSLIKFFVIFEISGRSGSMKLFQWYRHVYKKGPLE